MQGIFKLRYAKIKYLQNYFKANIVNMLKRINIFHFCIFFMYLYFYSAFCFATVWKNIHSFVGGKSVHPLLQYNDNTKVNYSIIKYFLLIIYYDIIYSILNTFIKPYKWVLHLKIIYSTLPSKSLGSLCAHQGCIYLIKNKHDPSEKYADLLSN